VPARGRRATGSDRRALGAAGEQAAADWYEAAGYRVLDRNWRVREGELDLVVLATDGAVVFCEVKTRTSDRFGAPVEAVTATKQRRIRTLAAQWLAAHPGVGHGIRFDVASVLVAPGAPLVVEVVQAGF
jgi:putative endonuclease